jgi:hypothetical protein
VAGQASGLRVYGEQRGAALADYDGDGRLDVVVTQNGAATRLFRNVRALPGVRVRLRGPAGNPTGVGASVQPVYGSRRGPVQEVRAGSGYWSQDSAVLVVAPAEGLTTLEVRWPGGRESRATVPRGAREVEVD